MTQQKGQGVDPERAFQPDNSFTDTVLKPRWAALERQLRAKWQDECQRLEQQTREALNREREKLEQEHKRRRQELEAAYQERSAREEKQRDESFRKQLPPLVDYIFSHIERALAELDLTGSSHDAPQSAASDSASGPNP